MPTFYKLFSSTAPIIKKLLSWRQGDEDERWAEKAIDSLIKKLKNRPDLLGELECVLSSKDPHSECITIPRSLDGRLQILHRKGLPHVIYCRIFRWPDLQSQHEIKCIDKCQYGFSKSLPDVCINPYHYERIEANIPPPVLIPRKNDIDILQNMANIRINHGLGGGVDNFLPFFPQQNSPQLIVGENSHQNCYTSVPFIDDSNWCIISYFELMNQVGEVFRASLTTVIVDGYANPITSGGRFSLGALSNVRRTQESDFVLGHIGHGIQLFYSSGDVFIENLSASSVFIQSSNLNMVKGFHPRAVVRVAAGSSLQIFYALEFSQILKNQLSLGYQAVNELTKQCDIHTSFIKGWGTGYSRQELTSCPCWLSIRLCTPLSWIDRVLLSMGSPRDPISSYT